MIAARAAALLALVLLCACGTTPLRTVSANGEGVSFELSVGDEAAAERQASLYCANLGRSAMLQSTEPAAGGRTIAHFACR